MNVTNCLMSNFALLISLLNFDTDNTFGKSVCLFLVFVRFVLLAEEDLSDMLSVCGFL